VIGSVSILSHSARLGRPAPRLRRGPGPTPTCRLVDRRCRVIDLPLCPVLDAGRARRGDVERRGRDDQIGRFPGVTTSSARTFSANRAYSSSATSAATAAGTPRRPSNCRAGRSGSSRFPGHGGTHWSSSGSDRPGDGRKHLIPARRGRSGSDPSGPPSATDTDGWPSGGRRDRQNRPGSGPGRGTVRTPGLPTETSGARSPGGEGGRLSPRR
jgi:hypothetical protein